MLNSKQKLIKNLKNLCLKLTGTPSKKKSSKLIINDIVNNCGTIDEVLAKFIKICTNMGISDITSIKDVIKGIFSRTLEIDIKGNTIEEVLDYLVAISTPVMFETGYKLDINKVKTFLIKYLGTIDLDIDFISLSGYSFTEQDEGRFTFIVYNDGGDIGKHMVLLNYAGESPDRPLVNEEIEVYSNNLKELLESQDVIDYFSTSQIFYDVCIYNNLIMEVSLKNGEFITIDLAERKNEVLNLFIK